MKKIAMFTMGTRGDVQPYIFLAQELNKNGYDIVRLTSLLETTD